MHQIYYSFLTGKQHLCPSDIHSDIKVFVLTSWLSMESLNSVKLITWLPMTCLLCHQVIGSHEITLTAFKGSTDDQDGNTSDDSTTLSHSIHSSTWGLSQYKDVILPGLGSIHFFQFNSIPIQVGFKIFQFNSILIQTGFRIFQFNSNSIQILSIPIQFDSNFMHRNKQISQIIGYFKFNLNISLFAAQFRKYIIQDHNSRINKSALVQVLC